MLSAELSFALQGHNFGIPAKASTLPCNCTSAHDACTSAEAWMCARKCAIAPQRTICVQAHMQQSYSRCFGHYYGNTHACQASCQLDMNSSRPTTPVANLKCFLAVSAVDPSQAQAPLS
eukprot:1152352-Pelagomonas_calceolata.AAC.8